MMLKPPSHLSEKQAVKASSTIEASQPRSILSLTNLQPEQALARQLQVPPLLMQQSLITAQKEEQDQKTKRPHLISHPLPNDVLFGRGRPLQAHHGNLRFHRIINKFRDKYKNAPKDEKATITATVLAEVSTADPPSLSTNDDPHEDKKTTSQNDRHEFANHNEVESASTYAASSRPHNIDTKKRNKGGRFLKRTESGNNWIEVSTAEAMEKASHALRGLKRRSELHMFRSSSDSASLATTTAAIGDTAMSSSFASPSSTVCSGSRDKESSSIAGNQETSPSQPKKKNRSSNSQQQVYSTTMTNEDTTATLAVAAAALQTRLTAGSAIRNPLDTLMGAPFPTTLQDTLAARSYLIPEQTASSSIQQQQLQSQLLQYLAIHQEQLQQQEYQSQIQQLRQDIHRQIVVEIMAQQLVQQEQEHLQAHQQQQLLTEQAIQRQLLLQQYQQQQRPSSVPTQHHHHTTQQLSQQLAPQTSSNSLIASFLRGGIASLQQREQQQQQQQQQNLMLQQLLIGTAAFDRQRDHSREEGKDDDVKPPAR